MEILQIILHGIGIGLLMAMTVGPVFVTLVQHSLYRGYKATFPIIVGVSVSDIFFATVSYQGLTQFTDNYYFQLVLSIAGGTVLFTFGVLNLTKIQSRDQPEEKEVRSSGFLRQFITGILINGVNPIVLLFWVGVVGTVTISYEAQANLIPFLIAAMLVTLFLTDNLKALLAQKLSKLVTPRILRILNLIVGVVFILFSFRLFYHGYTLIFE